MAIPTQAIIQSNDPIKGAGDVVDDSKRHVVAVVSDNTFRALRSVNVSSVTDLKNQLRSVAIDIESTKELAALGVGSILDLTEPVIPPTPEQIALRNFVQTYSIHKSAQAKVLNGLVAADAPEVVKALGDAQRAYAVNPTLFVGIG